jgi:hypothetical protein
MPSVSAIAPPPHDIERVEVETCWVGRPSAPISRRPYGSGQIGPECRDIVAAFPRFQLRRHTILVVDDSVDLRNMYE